MLIVQTHIFVRTRTIFIESDKAFNYTMLVRFFLLSTLSVIRGVPHTPTVQTFEEADSIKEVIKSLSEQLEKWNLVNTKSLLASTTLANIDSNIRNLQERAHVWDTFQLHVSAWNEQLAIVDRKLDIISKGQEAMLALEAKINGISNVEYKMEAILKRMENIEDISTSIQNKLENQNPNRDNLFGEFATRGILSTLKLVERKLDRIQLNSQNAKPLVKKSDENKGKLTIKCTTPPVVEELLHDVASKVDVIFDKLNSKENEDNDLDTEEYMDDQVSEDVSAADSDLKLFKKIAKRFDQPWKLSHGILEQLNKTVEQIYNNTLMTLNKETCADKDSLNCDAAIQKLEKIVANMGKANDREEANLKKYFNKQNEHIKNIFKSCQNKTFIYNRTLPVERPIKRKLEINNTIDYLHSDQLTCDELEAGKASGTYILGDRRDLNEDGRDYYTRVCEIREDGQWTVIQRRGESFQNFSLSWKRYKNGFGSFRGDLWFGNEFIHRLSSEHNLILRVELEDFESNTAWAEYNRFKVESENENYKLIVDGYSGNASDSLSAHNNYPFSTYDRKNDQAPECCPCAISYGGGWWFNSCFEANLNGVYFNNPGGNDYYRGLIWENWLGNYSLRKTKMMIRITTDLDFEKKIPTTETTTLFPYIEDP